MIQSETLEDLIRRHILLGKRSAKGYEEVKCALCNDYKSRGGFKFDGERIHYRCFNCSTSTGYDPSTGSRHSIPKKFNEVLTSFGIPEDLIKKCVSFNFFKPEASITKEEKQERSVGFPTKECLLPKNSIKVSEGTSEWCEIASNYLDRRGLSASDFDYYITDETSYVGRIIIPYYFRNKIIYWQGRSLDDGIITPRYKNPSVEKENIFFNMDELYRHTTDNLYVTEGPLDALSIGRNSVAILGASLSEFKLKELQKVAQRRKVIFVIDKNKVGKKLGEAVLHNEQLEFYVTCFPDNIDDSNDALKKYGKLWLASYLASSFKKGFSGKLILEMNCSK